MENISIITSQNVALQFKLAHVGDRLIANVIDGLILLAYGLFLLFLNWAWEGLPISVNVVLGLPFLLYRGACEIFMNGQSVGMRQRSLRVVKLDGSQVTIGNYLIRWALRTVDILLTIGAASIVSITFTKHGQRLGDIAAGTTIIKESKKEALNLDMLEENIPVEFPQARQLSDFDIAIIKETLEHYSRYRVRRPVDKLALRVKDLLNVETTKNPLQFLKVVVRDYYVLTSGKTV